MLVAYIQINNSVFLSSPLMSVVLRDTARIGMISVGIVLVMITGEIDLSVGATFAMAPYLMIRMSTDWGWSLWLAAPVAILLGVGVGFFNGFITVKLRIPSLITTLGTFFLLTGFTVSFAHSQPIRMPVQQPFNLVFGQNRFGPLDSLFSWDGLTGFTPYHLDVGSRADPDARPFPHRLWPSCDLHRQQPAGRSRDRRAHRSHEDRRLHDPGWIGRVDRFDYCHRLGLRGSRCRRQHLTLYAIAAAVIGGTALTGGSGTVIGALIGAFVIACLNNGLVLLGAQATESNFYLGAAILAAMILNVQVDAVRVRRKR